MHSKILRRTFSAACKSISSIEDEINLIGRDFIAPHKFTGSEYKSLLWTAMCIRHCSKDGHKLKLPIKKPLQVTAIADCACVKMHVGLTQAAEITGSCLNIIVNRQWRNTFKTNMEDFGRMLSSVSDIIFINTKNESAIRKVADGANVPVIGIECFGFCTVQILAELMALQTYYNRLKELNFAWVGNPGQCINTYLTVLPKLGINIKYTCFDNQGMAVSPSVLHHAMKCGQQHDVEIHESNSVTKTLYRADIIGTSYHASGEFKITMKHLEEAAIKWSLLHPLPRGEEVDDEVFKQKNVLTWESIKNIPWIYTAIIVRFLMGYDHVIPKPSFDDIEAGFEKKT